MGENWKDFETNATLYLTKNFGSPLIKFKQKGSSDSTNSDIELYIRKKLQFGIQCKYTPSQSSQFVLINTGTKFVFSEKNRGSSAGTMEIIEYMNQNFNHYSQNLNSIDLTCSSHLMYNRVILHHKAKNELFFVASEYVEKFSVTKPIYIDRIEFLSNYFNISGKFRFKRSGSSKAKRADVSHLAGVKFVKDRCYLFDKDNSKPRYLSDNLFLQSANKDGWREIRKLSSTNNKNVIFTLDLKPNISTCDFSRFSYEIAERLKASVII